MQIQLEFNQRLGQGFQIRMLGGPICKVYDDDPLTLLEAMACVQECVDELNKELGTTYKVEDIMVTSSAALKENARADFTAARVLQDIETRKYELSTPAGPDVLEAVMDGEKQPVVSGRGVILLAWAAWKEDSMPKARDVLRRYCEYVSARGYRGGASKAMGALCSMGFNAGASWIKRTYAQHIEDDVALMSYVLPGG